MSTILHGEIASMAKENVLLALSFNFSKALILFYSNLEKTAIKDTVGKQLLRSGTAIGALSREAQNAESTADFIHKMSIALKECNEAIYWLDLLSSTIVFKTEELVSLKQKATSLYKILCSIIISTKQNSKN